MQKCKVLNILNVNKGLVVLDYCQYKARKHNLKPVKLNKGETGLCEVVNPVMFKVGEIIGLDVSKLTKHELKGLKVLVEPKPEVKYVVPIEFPEPVVKATSPDTAPVILKPTKKKSKKKTKKSR